MKDNNWKLKNQLTYCLGKQKFPNVSLIGSIAK